MEETIWIASYPRSGNTFLRMLLWQGLGLRTGSLYFADLGHRQALEQAVGHVEHDPPGELSFRVGEPWLIKTHSLCPDSNRAIYVVRDGRAAAVSLWRFAGGQIPLETIVAGESTYGSWQEHVESWQPTSRPGTLLVRYEDMEADPWRTVADLADFLGRPIVGRTIPSREELASLDGHWVRAKTDWREHLPPHLERAFVERNARQLAALGYAPDGVDAASALVGGVNGRARP